jgi:chromate transporter
MSSADARTPLSARLRELALVFLRLGVTAFGGPAAHIAMMEEEIVARRAWLTREELLDLVGAANLIPGPNSTEVAIHIGLRRAGWLGFVVAGACFIVPAALTTAALAWAYVRFGASPPALAILLTLKPVVLAVVVQALGKLARTAMKSRALVAVGAAALIASALGAPEIAVLAAAGLVAMILRSDAAPRDRARGQSEAAFAIAPASMAVAGAASGAASVSAVFFVFLKIGSVLFGSGYVLLAFLRADLVERTHWLTEGQLLDAVAAGQLTPGPVFTTATFIGYLLGRAPGAAAATIGIFLPAFVFVALSGPLVPRIRRSPSAGAFLDGVNVASLALMALVTWQLSRAAVVDAMTLIIALVAFVLLVRFKASSTWLVVAAAMAGVARMLIVR